jgi:hypothetical protein
MGRGDRHKIRWAHDRARKKKEREKRRAVEGAGDKKKK